MLGVGVLVVELRHDPGLLHGEAEEADRDQNAPNSAENEGPADRLNAVQVGDQHLLLLEDCRGVLSLSLTANFVAHRWEEGLDKEGAEKEAATDEEVESVDEGSALLWTESEDQQDTVRREEESVAEELKSS